METLRQDSAKIVMPDVRNAFNPPGLIAAHAFPLISLVEHNVLTQMIVILDITVINIRYNANHVYHLVQPVHQKKITVILVFRDTD